LLSLGSTTGCSRGSTSTTRYNQESSPLYELRATNKRRGTSVFTSAVCIACTIAHLSSCTLSDGLREDGRQASSNASICTCMQSNTNGPVCRERAKHKVGLHKGIFRHGIPCDLVHCCPPTNSKDRYYEIDNNSNENGPTYVINVVIVALLVAISSIVTLSQLSTLLDLQQDACTPFCERE
jgi:hypothetical protein